jgi:proline iminopeptidase
MRQPYPEIAHDDSGLLEVGDGHRIYWEACGVRGGKPAVVLHGGPGSGCGPRWRRLFDPRVYRIVLFDQRGCGRSVPHASGPGVDLTTNTTHHLIADVELLRRHLSIERWLVLGGSWGSTLALAYGQHHPQRVTELVLFSVVTTTRREVEWVTRHAGRFFPAQWARFRDGVPRRERDGSLVEAYNRLLLDPDPAVHEQAARDWCAWEDTHVRTRPYWRHAAWLEDGALLRNVDKLTGIPGVLIHGRLDLSAPLDVPWMLTAAWHSSELVVIDDAGHTGGPTMTAALIAATDGFAQAHQ